MNKEYNQRRKKQVLLVLLVVLIFAFVALLSSYGIIYIYKQPDSSQIITDSNISESPSQVPGIPEPQQPPNPLQDPSLQHSSQSPQVPNIPEPQPKNSSQPTQLPDILDPQQPPNLPQPLNSSQSTQVPNIPEQPPNPNSHESSLKEIQEHILLNFRNQTGKLFSIAVGPSLNDIPPRTCLIDMTFMDETAFILFWYSYGSFEKNCPKATGWNLIKELNEKMFDKMKENYVNYMKEVVLKELLSTHPENTREAKEDLLFRAISLYQERFRSIWARIPGKTGKFDDLKTTFLIYQKVIDFGIHYSLEYLFKQINANLENTENNGLLLYSLKMHFYDLAVFLSNDENQDCGFRWIASQRDPLLILGYFYYLSHPPGRDSTFILEIKQRKKDPRTCLSYALSFLRKKLKYQVSIVDDKVLFRNDFLNPFPAHIIQTNELKAITTKIISKLFKLCSDYENSH
jgi:hypothetical protein